MRVPRTQPRAINRVLFSAVLTHIYSLKGTELCTSEHELARPFIIKHYCTLYFTLRDGKKNLSNNPLKKKKKHRRATYVRNSLAHASTRFLQVSPHFSQSEVVKLKLNSKQKRNARNALNTRCRC